MGTFPVPQAFAFSYLHCYLLASLSPRSSHKGAVATVLLLLVVWNSAAATLKEAWGRINAY